MTMVEDTMTVVYEPILQADTVEARSQEKGEILIGVSQERGWGMLVIVCIMSIYVRAK